MHEDTITKMNVAKLYFSGLPDGSEGPSGLDTHAATRV